MSNRSGLMFPKPSGKRRTPAENDKQLKAIVFYLWKWYEEAYIDKKYYDCRNNEARCMKCGIPLKITDIGIYSHIKKRGSHAELKYEIDNIQILCPMCHNEQEKTGADLRPQEFVAWLKEQWII